MFVYVTNIQTESEAIKAIQQGAAGICVDLGQQKPAYQVEETRDWLEKLPLQIMKIGSFFQDPYYAVEEMATFCHLDMLLLQFQDDLAAFRRHSGRVLVALTDCQLQDVMQKSEKEKLALLLETADGLVLEITDYTNFDNIGLRNCCQTLQKPIFLAGDFDTVPFHAFLQFLQQQKFPMVCGVLLDYQQMM